MPLDEAFLERVSCLYNPMMGTELISQLLYSLVRSLKPRRALEVGLGYTTPFLLRALADNVDDHEEHLDLLQANDQDDPATAVLLPDYFTMPYEPLHVGIDNLMQSGTTAHGVMDVTGVLGLGHLLRLHVGDFRGMSHHLRAEYQMFDFVWFDCGGLPEYTDFLEEYWSLINPDGGILVLHSTLTNMALRDVVNGLKLKQATDAFNEFELISLLEPHKLVQNSLTMLRMTANLRTPIHTIHP